MINRIAELDRVIEFKAPTAQTLPSGQKKVTYSLFHRAKAKVIEEGSAMVVRAGQMAAEGHVTFGIRYKEGINTTMAVGYNGIPYRVTSVSECEYKGKFYRNRFLKVVVRTTTEQLTHQFVSG